MNVHFRTFFKAFFHIFQNPQIIHFLSNLFGALFSDLGSFTKEFNHLLEMDDAHLMNSLEHSFLNIEKNIEETFSKKIRWELCFTVPIEKLFQKIGEKETLKFLENEIQIYFQSPSLKIIDVVSGSDKTRLLVEGIPKEFILSCRKPNLLQSFEELLIEKESTKMIDEKELQTTLEECKKLPDDILINFINNHYLSQLPNVITEETQKKNDENMEIYLIGPEGHQIAEFFLSRTTKISDLIKMLNETPLILKKENNRIIQGNGNLKFQIMNATLDEVYDEDNSENEEITYIPLDQEKNLDFYEKFCLLSMLQIFVNL